MYNFLKKGNKDKSQSNFQELFEKYAAIIAEKQENLIFTILGVIIGLVFGTFLTTGLISSIEIDSLRFMQNITIFSYIYSAIITIAFSIIVNFIIHFVLKKINMIESLKSVE